MNVKHSIGDKVRVIDEDSCWFGKEGAVSRFNEDLQHNVFVWFDDNTQCNFRHKELEPLNDQEFDEVVIAVVKRCELRSGYSTYFENKLEPVNGIQNLPDGTKIYAKVKRK